ncbi:hypothetical protein C1646_724158 [Rhizophagus diaphanus]|nr:hypothetical protein C1646_724158 [Rhizophagus diaphanus] [Rhizophagus sp. MUCL 43196]
MDTSTTNQTSKPSTNFKIVIIFGLVMIIINGVCASYMLSRTLSRWFITKKSLPMSLRVPFYIALSDFIIFSINFPNMVSIFTAPQKNIPCNSYNFSKFFFIYKHFSYIQIYMEFHGQVQFVK